jgi:hypothetical protein
MATPQETLQDMIANMRGGGVQPPRAGSTGTMGGGTFNGKRVAGSTAPAGAQRSAVSMNGNASIRQPGMTAGQSSVPTDNPAGRLAEGNRLLDNPVQSSRTSTEANLNPQVGEALRRSLIEQQRLSGPTYGSMGAFERRDLREGRAANQESVNSNLAALQGIREGSIAERGQNMASTTTLEDRQMQEAGAFDRSLLALDNTMLEGQFGLTDRAAANEGLRDPLKMFALAQLQGLTGPDATAADNRQAANAALGLSEFAGPGAGPTFKASSMGLEGEFTAEQLKDPQNLALAAQALGPEGGSRLLADYGYAPDPDSVLGIKSLKKIAAESEAMRKQRVAEAQAEEKARSAAVAAYLRDNTLDPAVRTNAINTQTRN